MRRILVILVTLFVGLIGLGVVGASPPAVASPTGPTIANTGVTFDPVETRFDSQAEALTVVVEVDVPTAFNFDRGILRIVDRLGITHTDWIRLDSQSRIGQIHKVTFKGNLPNVLAGGGGLNRGYLKVYPDIYYTRGALTYRATLPSPTYYYPHAVNGDTKATIAGPASITTGSALPLTGNVSCFKVSSYQAVEQGVSVLVEYSQPGANSWTNLGSTQAGTDGNWSFTVPSVGATLDWRTTVYPNSPPSETCAYDVKSNVINVVAGTQPPPPPPPTLPGAPGLVVSGTTVNSISVNVTESTPVPNQSTITGYRYGWVSANGQPQPSFSEVVNGPLVNPHVFSNLAAGTGYSVFVEAVTADGPGARTTLAAATSSPPPPPPVVKVPGAPTNVEGKARNHKAIITWDAPNSGEGIATKYCVHQFNHSPDKCVSASKFKVRFKGLTNGLTYSFTVQAFNGDVPGPLSAVVKVKPKRR